MIYSIINDLLPYFTALNFADRVAGICYPVELPILSENNETIIKRFPVIENSNKNQCDGNDYISLIPDDSLKSLIYHELISDIVDEDNDSYQQHTATVRLVAWFNLRNINSALTNCEQLLQLINNKIPFIIADTGAAYRITCETTDKRIRDKSIFAAWSYSESEKQYLIYPFDFGHITMRISYRLNKCADDIVINPNSCNDLKAYPFAIVYDKNQVIELHADDTYTCITYDYRHDFVSPMDYIGKAVTGSLDSDSVWTITRNEYFLGGAVITKTATDVKWTERLITIYI